MRIHCGKFSKSENPQNIDFSISLCYTFETMPEYVLLVNGEVEYHGGVLSVVYSNSATGETRSTT
ncbi:MAG: hypothetical protein IJC66_03405, partial [Kiritimatiellae bacterium]|nr:hypothetical protein [Kiritimatiellia bacterium]